MPTPVLAPAPARRFAGTTYSGWHVWLWKHHRLATKPQPCAVCAVPAQAWAQVGVCSEARWGTASGSGSREMTWCTHLDHYTPMCHRCHKATDANRGAVTRTGMKRRPNRTTRERLAA